MAYYSQSYDLFFKAYLGGLQTRGNFIVVDK